MAQDEGLYIRRNHHGKTFGQWKQAVFVENIGVLLVWVCTMQPFAETEFLAKINTPGLGGKEGIGSAFDDELATVERNAVCGDLAAPIRSGLDECDVCTRDVFLCMIGSGKTRNAAADNDDSIHDQPASFDLSHQGLPTLRSCQALC
jgi:hypothetical protein